MKLLVCIVCVIAALTLSLGCATKPQRPDVGVGKVENLEGRLDCSSANLIGIDLLLDGGSTAFFLKDKNNSVVILRYSGAVDKPLFAFLYSDGSSEIATRESLGLLGRSLQQNVNSGRHDGDAARVELIKLINTDKWVERSIPYWRDQWYLK